MAKEFCPECGYHVHRSHSRGFHEKFVRTISKLKVYRCHECGWRGWIASETTRSLPPTFKRKLLPLLITILVALLLTILASYFINRDSLETAAPSAAPPPLPEFIIAPSLARP